MPNSATGPRVPTAPARRRANCRPRAHSLGLQTALALALLVAHAMPAATRAETPTQQARPAPAQAPAGAPPSVPTVPLPSTAATHKATHHPEEEATVSLVGAMQKAATHGRIVAERALREVGEQPAGWLPPMEMRLGAGPATTGLTSADARGVDGRIAVEQAIPLGGVRRAQLQNVRALTSERVALVLAVELSVQIAVVEAWYQDKRAQNALAHAQRALAIATQIADATQKLGKLGEATKVELASAQTAVRRAAVAVLDAEGALFATHAALGEAVGVAHPVAAGDASPLPEVPQTLSEHELRAHAARMPDVRAARAAIAVAQTESQTARSNDRAELLLGGELGSGVNGHNAMLSVGLRLAPGAAWQRNRRHARLAQAQATSATARAGVQENTATTTLRTALHEVHHSNETLREIELHWVPAATEAAQGWQRLFTAGQTSVTEVLRAQNEDNDAHAAQISAAADVGASTWIVWLLLRATETAP